MKITQTFNWNRRDFSYHAECENCGHKITSNGGYDDDNYYNNVIPNIHCSKCGKSTIEMNTFESTQPKYDPNIVI